MSTRGRERGRREVKGERRGEMIRDMKGRGMQEEEAEYERGRGKEK